MNMMVFENELLLCRHFYYGDSVMETFVFVYYSFSSVSLNKILPFFCRDIWEAEVDQVSSGII